MSLNFYGIYSHVLFINSYFLKGGGYLHLLRNVLPEFLDNLPLEMRLRLRYMHDGCPVHRAAEVVEHLNTTFREKWIGHKLQRSTSR